MTALSRLSRLRGFLERESLSVTLFGLFALVLCVRLPEQLRQDSWLTLVAGREVSGGLPRKDTLMGWTLGQDWVDQQWLAQLAAYGLTTLGGVRLALLAHVALALAAFALALYAARRLGGNARSLSVVAALAAASLGGSLQLRAQSFAFPLFVLLAWLLVADARRPGNRVFLVLPLLALWANLHGSIALAAALVALRGATLVYERRRLQVLRGLVLIGAAFLAPFASPYGFGLVDYYWTMLVASPFAGVVMEWRPPTPGATTAGFFAMAFLAVFLRARRKTTLFETLALALLLLAGLMALRNIVWFSLLALLVLAKPLAEELPSLAPRRRGLLLPVATGAAAVWAMAFVFFQPDSWLERHYPARAAEITAAEQAKTGGQVLPGVRFANWLVWQQPSLKGKVAYDARLELLTPEQVRDIHYWHNAIGDYERLLRPGDIVLVDRVDESLLESELARRTDMRYLYRDDEVAVLVRRANG